MQKTAPLRALLGSSTFPLGMVLLVVLACDGGTPDPDVTDYSVFVNVTNAGHHPIAGAVVNIDGQTVTTGSDGDTPTVRVRHGERRIAVTAEGYIPYSNTFVIARGERIAIEVRGSAQVSGQVLNSQNGQGIDGAALTFSRNGRVELTATTGTSGFFSLVDAPSGVFDLLITKSGFVNYTQSGVNITGGSFVLDPVAMAEVPPAGALRIVVSWGTAPPDLDAHLTGPGSSGGGRFHIYYFASTTDGATLDRDDTDGFGPETVTITTLRDGMYRYSIHNWTDRSLDGATAAGNIAASPTRVQVYNSLGLLKSYTAPPGGAGNVWRVFEMAVGGGTLTFSDGGGAGLGYFTASGSGDPSVFLTSGGDAPDTKASGR